MSNHIEVIPHRYTNHIGGSCIEVKYCGESILLDCGQPLHDPHAGIPELDYSRVSGILLSHSHMDHTGLAAFTPDHIPVWLHPAVQVQMNQLSRWGLGGNVPNLQSHRQRCFESDTPFTIGPFTITALAVDHSGFASHGFLIETDNGQRVYYSGDFRNHGNTSFRFDQTLTKLETGVDILICEGTTLSRPNADNSWSEKQVQLHLEQICRDTPGPVLLWAATSNVDRMVSAWKAAKGSGRDFTPDIYTSDLLEQLSRWSPSLPHMTSNHSHYRTLVTRQWVRRANMVRLEHLLRRPGVCKVSYASLTKQGTWHNVLMLVRPSMRKDLEPYKCHLREGTLVYSLWSGYRDQPEYSEFIEWCRKIGMKVVTCHAGGHATPRVLEEFRSRIPHREFVRVHTESV